MKNIVFVLSFIMVLSSCSKEVKNYRELSLDEYRDKMQAAWIGQMAGVGWGAPTEFDYPESIIPADSVPKWTPRRVNQYSQDDIYVEMTFLQTLEKYGIDVSIRQAGIDFANTEYRLWAANNAGRNNLRSGIAPPESSHPDYNVHCDDIDYQIEADFSGILAPGMPQVPVELGEKFGRLMNYGDGMYAGQFVGAMYSAAYFETDMEGIVEAGLESIPRESLYAQVIRDVLAWYREDSINWMDTWQKLEDKYYRTKENQPFAAANEQVWLPIDSKLNGAYIVMGLLYGNRDIDFTILISMRCGKDSDCNPSNAGGILFTTIGYENLPDRYKSMLVRDRKFSHSEYDFETLLSVCEDLTRKYIVAKGGKTEKEESREVFYLPVTSPSVSEFHSSSNPGPYDPDNRYTEEEMARIRFSPVESGK